MGLATNLRNRIKHHLGDKHEGKWTHCSLYIIHMNDYVKELESLLLRIAYPVGNRQQGKLAGSKNVLPGVKREVKIKIKKEMEDLFRATWAKRTTAKKKVRRAGTTAKGERLLDGVFPGGKVIYAMYKGKDYKAWVNSVGRIRLAHNHKVFDTPSGVGAAVRGGKATNGWVFWKMKDKKGELVRIGSLRQERWCLGTDGVRRIPCLGCWNWNAWGRTPPYWC